MPVFGTDWTPPQEVMSSLTQSLPSLWGQLEAALPKRVITATFTATSCDDVAQLRHSRTLSALPVCVGKACGKYCGIGRRVLSGCMATKCTIISMNEYSVLPKICQCYCHVNSAHMVLINWRQWNSLFTKCLYDDPLRRANHKCHKTTHRTTNSTCLLW